MKLFVISVQENSSTKVLYIDISERPQSYYYNDDTFNFDYGQAKAAVGNYAEAEDIFLNISNEKLKQDYAYLSWLARCFIMNNKVGIVIHKQTTIVFHFFMGKL